MKKRYSCINKSKAPAALMLLSAAWVTSSWAIRAPSPDQAPMPNYDVRMGYSSVNLNDPRLKEESKTLMSQRSKLLAGVSSAKALSVAAADGKKLKELFGEGVTVNFKGAGSPPSLLFSEDGPLTKAEPKMAADNAALQFLQSYPEVFGLSLQEIVELDVVRTLTSGSGSKQVNLRQTINGIPVFGADLKTGLDKNNAVLSVGGSAYPGLQLVGKPALTAAEAVEHAARHVGQWSSNGALKSLGNAWNNTIYLKDWSDASIQAAQKNAVAGPQILKTENTPDHKTILSKGPFKNDIAASLVAFPLTNGQARLGWQVLLQKSMTEWYQVVVDAENGSLLNRTNLVQFANEQGNVFVRNPTATPLSTVSLNGVAPATVGSYAFASSSGQAGNNVFMMIGANEKPATTHDYTYPFANSYFLGGGAPSLQPVNLAAAPGQKLTFVPNASGGYDLFKLAVSAIGAGTNLALTDDSTACAPPGFPFSYFGQPVTNVCVNSNGNLTFETGDTSFTPDLLEVPPRGRIMPLFTDLLPNATNNVTRVGNNTNTLCFVWNGVPEFTPPAPPPAPNSNTFSTCIFNNNGIWLQYPSGGLTATSAFVGIRPPGSLGANSHPIGASSWTPMNANDSTRGSTGLVRFFPDMGADEKVLATNLFWQFNQAHDRLWVQDGFDDVAGNFQLTNTGGGIGGDPVILSGIPVKLGTNNAFFGTPPDGQCCGFSGFFLFTNPPFLNVASGLDSDVTRHEFGHGVTNRLVGGPANADALTAHQSGAMGEGWSDFYAISYDGGPVVGEFSTGNAATGIRTVAYTAANGRELGQYGNLLGAGTLSDGSAAFLPEVHQEGEIWASLLADVRRALMAPAPGPALTSIAVEKLVTEALFFTPPNPSMVDAANALFIADASLYGGSHGCTLWNALKGRGFGKHAANNEVDASTLWSGNSYSVFASHDRPAACGGAYNRGNLINVANFDAAAVGATSADGWSAVPAAAPNLWHVSARRSTTGARSFYYGQEATGNYFTGANTFGGLVSPLLNLGGTAHPVLEFDVFMGTPGAFPRDIIWVQLSTDGGLTFPKQRSILFWPTAGNFHRVRIDMDPLKGVTTAKVRLYFDDLGALTNGFEGVYIDNIQVRDYGEI